jgi:hypothetical protein
MAGALIFAACGGEAPEPNTNNNDQDAAPYIAPEEEWPTGIGDKPPGYVDPCATFDETVTGDVTVMHDRDAKGFTGVTTLDGDLNIVGGLDLTGMACLQEVTGHVRISGTETLKDLGGLERLTRVGGSLWITENAQLATIENLATLKRVGGDIIVERNEALVSLTGLENVRGDLRGGVQIRENDALVEVFGFEYISGMQSLTIENNPMLEEVRGFWMDADHYTVAYEDITVVGNDALRVVELPLSGADRGENNVTVAFNEKLKEARMWGDEKFRVTGDVTFEGNPALRAVAGFDRMLAVVGDFMVVDNDAWDSLDAFRGLQVVGGDVQILDNDAITDIEMWRLGEVGGDLTVMRNDNLETLTGLGALGDVWGEVTIADNTMLNDCSKETFSSRVVYGRSMSSALCSGR